MTVLRNGRFAGTARVCTGRPEGPELWDRLPFSTGHCALPTGVRCGDA